MAEKRVGVIRISKGVVQIGPDDYPLKTISHVHADRVPWTGRLATCYPVRQMVALAAVTGAIVAIAVKGGAGGLGVAVGVMALLPMAYLGAVLYYRIRKRKDRYVLILGTAGAQYTVVRGTNGAEIARIRKEIIRAIEEPPSEERVIHIAGDVVFGDKAERDVIKPAGNVN